MKFCEYISKRLENLGCTYVFGLPGSYIMPIWQAVGSTSKLILSRHESGSAYMADGWSKFNGSLGVVLTTIGPGITNVITGIAGAYKDSIPLLVITGQADTTKIGSGVFQESSEGNVGIVPTKIMSSVCKASFEITSVGNAIDLFEKALTIALSGRNGPVHLSIPKDIQISEITSNNHVFSNKNKIKNTFYDEHLFSKIDSYKRPLILVGWGSFLSNSSDKILEFSSKINAPIISTVKGLSAVSYYWDLFVGNIGPGANKEVFEFIKEYSPDALIFLGCGMNSYYMDELLSVISKDADRLQVDISEEQIGYNYNVNFGINADIRMFLDGILTYLKDKKVTDKNIISKILEWKSYSLTPKYIDEVSKAGLMAKSIYELNKLLPVNSTVIPDAGNHWLDTLSLYRTKSPFGLCTNSGLGTMGHAIGASIGMKLANPEKRIICISGDGSMLMSGCEISVIPELEIDNIYIVYNNESLGRVREWQNSTCGNTVATDITKVNFSEWAKSQGIYSYQVNDINEFSIALKEALKRSKASLIEVLIDKDERPFCFIH